MHPKTLSACFVLESSTRVNNLVVLRDLLEVVMESGARDAPLHLKILAMHEDFRERGQDLIIQLSDLKLVLMPRQWLLKKLDPDNKLSVAELRAALEDDMIEYKALIV